MTRASLLLAIGLAIGCSRPEPARDPEAARIAQHLATVEAELRAADVSRLDGSQRAARAVHIERLRRYREAGVFPHNHGLAVRTPFFVDAHGTRCAMAYLIEQSGGGALVAAVAATHNNATVPELADQPGLAAWLDHNGLSLDEAARIQPAYDPCVYEDCAPPEDDRIDATFALASTGVALLDGVAIAVNLRADAGDGYALFGLIAGGAAVAVGAPHLDEDDRNVHRMLGWADVGIGLATTIVAVHALLRDEPAPPPPPPGAWSVAPTLGDQRGVSIAVRW